MRVGLLAVIGLAAGTAIGPRTAFADAQPARASVSATRDHGLRNGGGRDFFYEEKAVYAVTAKPGRITDVVLEPGERLVGTGPIAAGDTARWVIGDTISGEGEMTRVHVMLKPTEAGLATNLIINTDRRTYHLDLRSSSQAWDSHVAWRYRVVPPVPPPTPPLRAHPSAEDAVTRLNFGYLIKGPRVAWRPMRVFDDGARTYVEFPPTIVMSDLPPLFAMGPDGRTSELINYRVTGQRITVDRLLDRAELRLGQGRSERRVTILRGAFR